MSNIYNHLSRTILLMVFGLFSITGYSQTIFVDYSATGADDGSSWADAYTSLKTALDNAVSGDELWVATGTYYPDPSDRTIYFQIPDGVKVYGGFLNTASTFSERDWVNNPTILSGDINTSGIETDNSFTVVYTENVGTGTELDGFTVEWGCANDGASIYTIHKKGGGWVNKSTGAGGSSDPIIRNTIFDNNYADKFAGAFYNNATGTSVASPTLINCTFTNNESDERGGAIANDGDSSVKIIGCNFDNNNSIEGGAIFCNGHDNVCRPTIINSVFSNNETPMANHGGAIYNFGKGAGGVASPEIINTLFYDNTAGHGGAIYGIATEFAEVMPEIINNTFHGNFAEHNGGAIYASESLYATNHVKVYNSIFWKNDNNSAGGPIFHFSGTDLPIIDLNNVLVDTTSCALLHFSMVGRVDCYGNMLYNVDPDFEDPANFDFQLKQFSPAINQGSSMYMSLDDCDIDGDGNMAEQIDLDLDLNPRFDGSSIDLGPYEKIGGLPIELLSFEARFDGKKVDLHWITLSETDNDYFAVEHSTNGIDFEEIIRQQGAGDSEQARNYLVHDENPATGFNYYRLKQVDFDGSYSYSQIRTVEVNNDFTVATFPNPVANQLNISLSNFEERAIDYQIFHVSGLLIHRGSADVNDGLVVVSLDNISSLKPGPYMIRISNTNKGDLYGQFIKVGL